MIIIESCETCDHIQWFYKKCEKTGSKLNQDFSILEDCPLQDVPSDTCGRCGCTELLCGHNKRGYADE